MQGITLPEQLYKYVKLKPKAFFFYFLFIRWLIFLIVYAVRVTGCCRQPVN